MTSYLIPEEIIGVPLFAPAQYASAFELDVGAMPNGDTCVVVRGDIDPYAKAVQIAPTLNPDIFHLGENPAAPNDWCMSCWLKLTDLPVSGTNRVMLGCSNISAANPFTSGTVNRNISFLLGVNGTQGAAIHRETTTNAASPSSTLNIVGTNATCWARVADRWHLCVFGVSGATGSLYIDDDVSAAVSDTFGGSALSGTLNAGMYLHLGPFGQTSILGRNAAWRIGKWAFHDHMLTLAERTLMYNAMFTELVLTDGFNRATLGSKWTTITASSAFDILTDEARGAGTTARAMYYNQSCGTPNMYGKAKVVNNAGSGGSVCVLSRVSTTAATFYMGAFTPSTGVWDIYRCTAGTFTQVANATSAMTPPGYLQFETETVGSDVVLRLYEVVGASKTLRTSFTDTSGSKILSGNFSGLRLSGNASVNQRADEFECGPLAA